MLTVGSLFSGIEGFGLGFARAGAEVEWHVEIDEECHRIIRSHFRPKERDEQGESDAGRSRPTSKHASLFGPIGDPVIYPDVRTVGRHNLTAVDLICGGFPCQDLSVAGKRAGLAGDRSGLWYEFYRVLAELHPEWVVIENVGGLLSSQSGRDLAIVLRGLAELGYWWAYRLFDAQYFGVAQRRERVFIVGHSRERANPAKVLFESESLPGHPAPRRKARQAVAGTLGGGSGERGWAQDTERMTFIPEVSLARLAKGNDSQDPTMETYIAHSLRAEGFDASEDGTGRGTPLVPTLVSNGDAHSGFRNGEGLISFSNTAGATALGMSRTGVPPLTSRHGDPGHVAYGLTVRRLTPTECERLQGFPDGWTAGTSDSARYRMLGNAVCVPVAEWIGRRIVEVAA